MSTIPPIILAVTQASLPSIPESLNPSTPSWEDASRYVPSNPRCVLAHDNEAHFIAVHENDLWYNAHLDEPIDSVIVGWQELPEIPDDL